MSKIISIFFLIMFMWNCAFADKPTVSQRSLNELIDRADRVVVFQEPIDDSQILYESSQKGDLEELKTALNIVPPDSWYHCMCSGSPAIYLYLDKKKIGQITNHHGDSIRCSIWDSDAMISDPEPYHRWFDKRGMRSVRKAFDEMKEREKKSSIALKKWKKAMPECLNSLGENVLTFYDPDINAMIESLKLNISDKSEIILSLLHWYGSGAGPWSGYPAYEGVAEKLIFYFSTSDILKAINSAKLTETQLEGAARFFGDGSFSRTRSNELKDIPDELKKKLLLHSLKSNDEDKERQAKRAFE